jgi:hypothetical protein
MLDFEPNASRFFAFEPRRLMHILVGRPPFTATILVGGSGPRATGAFERFGQ